MTATEAVAPTLPSDLLAYYGDIVHEEVQRTLRSEERSPLSPLVADYPGRPGKRLRPALLLAACEAFGGDLRDALPAAVSLELLHNAFLVHDDIEDASGRRRGKPSLHVQHGVPMAVHAGDALAVRAILPLLDQPRLSTHLVQRVTRELLETARRTLDGQSMELAWRDDVTRRVDLDDYLRLVLHKTCWYTTIYPLRAGCLIGSRGGVPLGPLTSFGFLLGAAFQVRDDVLDVAGDAEAHGKEAMADLREGKRTLLLVHLLGAVAPDERRWLEAYLATPAQERTPADAEAVLALLHAHGSIETATAWSDGLAEGARAAFPAAFAHAVSPFHARFVEQLIDYVVARPS
ncbi:MAG: polyprenyl synthetase family protein [Acidimicrobiales bacterium]|nr:polyprenyl synthetase family protein [Acidimicrobiales bacterium]